MNHPLRLTRGSHERGSGKGCAMNVISWENGDSVITDFPECSAKPLAKLVQAVNDNICSGHETETGYLCPSCSLTVLELGHQTVGTSSATPAQITAWMAELFDSPEWGIIRFAENKHVIRGVAELYRRCSAGDEPTWREWISAAQVTHTAYTVYPPANAYSAAAASAAAYNAAVAGTYYGGSTGAINLASDAAYAAAAYRTSALLELAGSAIAAWHRICGTTPGGADEEITAAAVAQMCAVG